MIRLRYPLEIGGSQKDYMMINSYDYEARGKAGAEQSTGMNEGIHSPSNMLLKLPIPELPNMVSRQGYGKISGALKNAIATGVGAAYHQIDNAVINDNGNLDGFDVGGIAEQLRAQINGQGGASPIVREVAAGMAATMMGINGPMFQSLATGEITNPNIELLYSGPTLRQFAMNWTFAPKNSDEALECYNIVRELKRAHLPSTNGAGKGMLKVPQYFTIKMFVDGKEAAFYQKFAPCFLESISIRQNSNGSHITLPNGEPAVTSMSTVWREIKITTREDFEDNI